MVSSLFRPKKEPGGDSERMLNDPRPAVALEGEAGLLSSVGERGRSSTEPERILRFIVYRPPESTVDMEPPLLLFLKLLSESESSALTSPFCNFVLGRGASGRGCAGFFDDTIG